jgi:amino acid transporter
MESMEKKYLYKLVLGIIIMIAGMLSVAFLEVDKSISISLISIGLIIFLVTVFRLFRKGEFPDRDERTKKLAAYGITYSWLLTLVLIAVLYWVIYFELVGLTAGGVLGILLFFMIVSSNVFRWYFMQKGDVE